MCADYFTFYSKRGGHAPALPASAPAPIYANVSGDEGQETTSFNVVSNCIHMQGAWNDVIHSM